MQGSLKDIPFKNNIYYPRTTDEVKRLIHFAKDKNLPIRTIGSGHSPISAIFDTHNKNLFQPNNTPFPPPPPPPIQSKSYKNFEKSFF